MLMRGMLGALASTAALFVAASPAAAGGSWLDPVRDRYEPGETVTLVGYTTPNGSLGSLEDGPFFGYLRPLASPVDAPDDIAMAPFTPMDTDLPLGELDIERQGREDYAAVRVSVRFETSSRLAPGRYSVIYCNATCTKGLSDLIAGIVFIGVDPDHPIARTWPLEEPEIAHLEDDAIVYGPGWQVRAAEVRPTTTTPPPQPVAAPGPGSEVPVAVIVGGVAVLGIAVVGGVTGTRRRGRGRTLGGPR